MIPGTYDGKSGTKMNSFFSNSIMATAPMYTRKVTVTAAVLKPGLILNRYTYEHK